MPIPCSHNTNTDDVGQDELTTQQLAELRTVQIEADKLLLTEYPSLRIVPFFSKS